MEKCVEKAEECVDKGEKCVKRGENHSDPIYTNPIKNLPAKRGQTQKHVDVAQKRAQMSANVSFLQKSEKSAKEIANSQARELPLV